MLEREKKEKKTKIRKYIACTYIRKTITYIDRYFTQPWLQELETVMYSKAPKTWMIWVVVEGWTHSDHRRKCDPSPERHFVTISAN